MKVNRFLVVTALVAIIAGCNSNTYSRLRTQEDKKIANYISRNGLNILSKLPENDSDWGEKDYYKVPGVDNFYFHLIKRGPSEWIDTIEGDVRLLSIMPNDIVVVRYKKFDLGENPDTLSYWTTLDQAYPYEFHYLNTTECEAQGWHLAVQYMQYPGSVCQIIQPSKLGFTDDQMSVTPYCYIMKIQVK